MTIKYFPDTDSLYIGLTNKASVEGEEIAPGFVCHFDAEGGIVSIEIDSNANKLVDLSKIELKGFPFNVSNNYDEYLIKHSIKAFTISGPWKLTLTFDDGVVKEVDLKGIDFGMYAALADLNYFNQVHLTDDCFTIEWPNGADFNPDTLYYWGERRADWLKRADEWHERESLANSILSEQSLG